MRKFCQPIITINPSEISEQEMEIILFELRKTRCIVIPIETKTKFVSLKKKKPR